MPAPPAWENTGSHRVCLEEDEFPRGWERGWQWLVPGERDTVGLAGARWQ